MFGTDAKGVDWQVHGDLTNNSIKWDSKINRLTIQKTFTVAGQIASYEYAQYIGLAFSVAIPTGKYVAGLKIAMEGSGNYNSGSSVFPLWIDYQNIGTNSSAGGAAIMVTCQLGACRPQQYMSFQSASPGVQHLLRLGTAQSEACVTSFGGTAHGGTKVKISLDLQDTEYFLLASTAPS